MHVLFLIVAFSFNIPTLGPSTTWYPDTLIVVNQTYSGTSIHGIFVDQNNTLYIDNQQTNQVHIFSEGSQVPRMTLSGGLKTSYSLYATSSGNVYIDNGQIYQTLVMWPQNASNFTQILQNITACYDIFIDMSNTIYCAAAFSYKIVKKWLLDTRTEFTVAAGTGTLGSSAQQLNLPTGIFVDTQFTMYVADYQNHRIQKFPFGQMDGITVAGATVPGTYTFYYPSDITLDSNGYMYIVDEFNHRLIAQGPYGFRCICGCDKVGGYAANQLYRPRNIAFDTHGNIYVSNRYSNRVQKLILASNSNSMLII